MTRFDAEIESRVQNRIAASSPLRSTPNSVATRRGAGHSFTTISRKRNGDNHANLYHSSSGIRDLRVVLILVSAFLVRSQLNAT